MSCITATTYKFISLCMMPLKQNKLESQAFDCKAILNEQYSKWCLILLCSRFLTKKDWLPRNGITMSSCFMLIVSWRAFPVDTGPKLNVHKTFRRRLGRLLNVSCTFNLRAVSTGLVTYGFLKKLFYVSINEQNKIFVEFEKLFSRI